MRKKGKENNVKQVDLMAGYLEILNGITQLNKFWKESVGKIQD